MNSERRKRRQAARRMKRDAIQNLMILKGWVPVKVISGVVGIYHRDSGRLVYREWGNRIPNPDRRNFVISIVQTGWYYKSATGTDVFNYIECSWSDLQAQWVRGLRAVAIQNGWM